MDLFAMLAFLAARVSALLISVGKHGA